ILGTIMISGLQGNFVLLTVGLMGVTEAKAAWMYTIFSLVMGAGGLVVGWISDKVLGPTKIIAITTIVGGVVTGIFVIGHINNVGMYVILICIIGLAIAAISTLIAVILMNAYGSKNFGINFGLIQCGPLVGSFIGPQLAVRTAETFMSIGAVALLMCGGMFLLAGIVLNKEIGKKTF
ncbi:MAG: MFS transporter, partial [Parasporobacterium sp.]|nr:MFS transporter [Parasporobacterium sp.]